MVSIRGNVREEINMSPESAHLSKVEELADFVCPLGTQAAWHRCIGQPRDLLFSLLHHHQVKDG